MKFLASFVLAFLVQAPAPPAAKELLFPTGKVVAHVVAVNDPAQSYALYLPSNYSPARKWPVLYLFDPMARGEVAVEAARTAAEKHGFVLACSNNSRNGPIHDSMAAAQAVWKDTHLRFNLDERRTYAAGLSGGARMAAYVAHSCKICIAGVFANSAGFPPEQPPAKDMSFRFFATAGDLDFNLFELEDTDATLHRLDLPHRLRVFHGGHEWAPPEIWDEALDWFDLEAMKDGRWPRDADFIAAQFRSRSDLAQGLEGSGDVYAAGREYRDLVADFAGLADVAAATVRRNAILSSSAYKAAVRKEHERSEQHARLDEENRKGLSAILNEPAERSDAYFRLRRTYAELRAKVDDKSSPEAPFYRMLFTGVLIQSSEAADDARRRKDDAAALSIYELITSYARSSPYAWFQLARLQAAGGHLDKAMQSLEKAVTQGFRDRDMLNSSPELSPLLTTAAGKQLLEKIASAPANAP